MENAGTAPVCKRLRTRMSAVLGRDHADLFEPSPAAQYWCSLTATVLGPDDVYCSPRVCLPERGCFEQDDASPGRRRD